MCNYFVTERATPFHNQLAELLKRFLDCDDDYDADFCKKLGGYASQNERGVGLATPAVLLFEWLNLYFSYFVQNSISRGPYLCD